MRERIVKSGFTLIELLIVVAIIAILAAIAVPNFLEAQTRSKVSRVRADLRSVATALESYGVDQNNYPLVRGQDTAIFTGNPARDPQDLISPPGAPARTFNQATLPLELTTPVSYITTTFKDPFKDTRAVRRYTGGSIADLVVPSDPTTMDYVYHNIKQYSQMSGYGFDDRDLREYGAWRLTSIGPDKEFYGSIGRRVYDPTNGTVSLGDIIRTQASSAGDSRESTSGSN